VRVRLCLCLALTHTTGGHIRSFNVNIDYSGLNFKDLVDSKEKELVHAALQSTPAQTQRRDRD
jgi:hypothetical protein